MACPVATVAVDRTGAERTRRWPSNEVEWYADSLLQALVDPSASEEPEGRELILEHLRSLYTEVDDRQGKTNCASTALVRLGSC
jgi:hypothetical protein